MTTGLMVVMAALASAWGGGGDASTVATSQLGSTLAQKGGLPSDCDAGLVYDDGTFETAIRAVTEFRSNWVMRFDPVVLERLDRVCLCWHAEGTGEPEHLTHSLRVWAADGPGGRPGSLLLEVPDLAVSLPAAEWPADTRAFRTYDLSALDFSFATPVYIGPSWSPADNPGFYLCADTGPDTPRRRSFSGVEQTGETQPPTREVTTSDIRALGIRAVTSPLGEAPYCTATPGALCLNDSRFRVEVAWDTGQGTGTGSTRTIPEVDFSGLFWFFNPSNLELIVKVLDGCAVNDHFWVYYAATTNVGFELTVRDMARATTKTYTNPLGQAAAPVQDTQAFPCNP